MARTIEYTTTSSRIKARVEGLDTSYTANDRTVDWYIYENGTQIDSDLDNSLGAGASYTSWVYFTGLDPDTEYVVEYIIYYNGGSVTDAYYITTDPSPKPDLFAWTYTKTQNGNFNLTAAEWNDFTDRINEELDYLGKSAVNFTQAVQGNNFTAVMYNQMVNAIKSMGGGAGGYLNTVSSGDTITAYMLNQAVAELNNAITYL